MTAWGVAGCRLPSGWPMAIDMLRELNYFFVTRLISTPIFSERSALSVYSVVIIASLQIVALFLP